MESAVKPAHFQRRCAIIPLKLMKLRSLIALAMLMVVPLAKGQEQTSVPT